MAHYPAKHYLRTESLMLEVLHGIIRLVHGFDSFIGMPRKFRLSVHRKNEFRSAVLNTLLQVTKKMTTPYQSVSLLSQSQ